MSCCVAYKCSKRQVSSSKLSFFRFPFNDKDRLQKWINNVKRKSWTPSKYSRLCSLHFTQDCLVPIHGRNTLKPDAVPTIFYPHCPVKVEVRHTRVSTNTPVIKPDPDTEAGDRETFSRDHDYISEPQSVEASVAGCSRSVSADHGAYTLNKSPSPSTLAPYKKKLKLQAQRVRRLKQKVKSLSSVVSALKEKLRRSPAGDVGGRLRETPMDVLQILLRCCDCDEINALPASVVPAAVSPQDIRGCSSSKRRVKERKKSVPSKSTQ